MFINGEMKNDTVAYADFEKYENQIVTIKGTIHNIRMMSDFRPRKICAEQATAP